MSIEQIIDVPASGQVTLQIPDLFKNRKKVKLVFNSLDETIERKILLLKKASQDKDFLADQEEVSKDFEFAESSIDD